MPNNYFQFKEFIVQQEKCTMKVCTDSCIFGAWIADKIERKIIAPKTILDIGAGTGLLSLMLAQKTNAPIDAIEVNNNCAQQATENFNSCRWNDRLQLFNADIKEWKSQLKYDLIIANPPFFENDLKPVEINKILAKHDEGLTLRELVFVVKNLLIMGGYFAVLLPFPRIANFETLAAKKGFYLVEKLLIKQTPMHPHFRGILLFHKTKITSTINELIIKNDFGYTVAFTKLLTDYYLAL